ncbi:thioesterase II family protein [Amycolatopsis sp. cmx-4-61]|uniref:thioesterase II family protein n=1 Tax=Amycolatopsis sp. cmx-4-61 TaxID=2790937 RepID=UPI00397AD966
MNALVFWPRPEPEAVHRLICCSYSGGGSVPFRPWRDALPPDTELVLLCYPGREGRFTDPLAERWDELLADALAAIGPVLDKPYHLFGHSMGALVAFELTAQAELSGARTPDALIVSSCEAPSNWPEHLELPPTAHDTDEELVRWVTEEGRLPEEVGEEPELMEIALEILRADLRAAEDYRYPGTILRTPIEFAFGDADPHITPGVVERWRRLTAGEFTATRLPGGHFYTAEAWAELPRSLTSLDTDRIETRTCQA